MEAFSILLIFNTFEQISKKFYKNPPSSSNSLSSINFKKPKDQQRNERELI